LETVLGIISKEERKDGISINPKNFLVGFFSMISHPNIENNLTI
jgi:hypothetical protein